MPELNALLTSMEQYDMTVQYLSVSNAPSRQYNLSRSTTVTIHIVQSSKILKVMGHIILLDKEKIPRNAEYNFLDRAQILVDKWRDIMHPDQPMDIAEGKPENGDGMEVNMAVVEVGIGGPRVAVDGDVLVEWQVRLFERKDMLANISQSILCYSPMGA